MKTYINSVFINSTKYTDQLTFSGKVDKIIEELKSVANEKGYINLTIAKKQKPSEHSTHYLYKYHKEESEK